jgi:hypothetical protein
MTTLAPVLGRSPRALKRFVNVYRLIKVGLFSHEQRTFLRQREPLADYEIVLFLLAVDTGTPTLARSFFSAIDRGGKKADAAPAKNSSQAGGTLQSLITELNREYKGVNQPDWKRLRDWLNSDRKFIPLSAELTVFGAWTNRVGRYSFEIGRP